MGVTTLSVLHCATFHAGRRGFRMTNIEDLWDFTDFMDSFKAYQIEN